MVGRAAIVSAACWCFAAGVSLPAGAMAQAVGPNSEETAKALIESGRAREARPLLEQRLQAEPRNVELLFLLGMACLAEGDNRSAIAAFRTALIYAPRATRIRLELARAFYRARDYENAFRQFQFARAGNLPPGVVASIQRYETAIRLEKAWSYNLSLALAPDTNINNATSAQEVEIFGLPFQLDAGTRRKSGVGIAVEGGAEFAPRIGRAARWRIGASVESRDYPDARFDDTTLALHTGPRLIAGKWDLSFVGTAFQRWYGGQTLDQGVGARGEATWYPDPRTAVSFGASAQQIQYRRFSDQSGPLFAGWAGVVHALTPSSSVVAHAGLSRQDARSGDLAYWAGSLGVGYYRDLPGGFSIYAEPSIGLARYDAPDPFLGVKREDRLAEVQLSVLNRRIVFSRFTPRLTYTFARRSSNIGLYSFTQNRVEMGLTTTF